MKSFTSQVAGSEHSASTKAAKKVDKRCVGSELAKLFVPPSQQIKSGLDPAGMIFNKILESKKSISDSATAQVQQQQKKPKTDGRLSYIPVALAGKHTVATELSLQPSHKVKSIPDTGKSVSNKTLSPKKSIADGDTAQVQPPQQKNLELDSLLPDTTVALADKHTGDAKLFLQSSRHFKSGLDIGKTVSNKTLDTEISISDGRTAQVQVSGQKNLGMDSLLSDTPVVLADKHTADVKVVSHHVKSVPEPVPAAFDKIPEPKKSLSEADTAQVQPPQQKNLGMDSRLPYTRVALADKHTANIESFVNPAADNGPQLPNGEVLDPHVSSSVEPWLPMHNVVSLGKDSDNVSLTDGPKTKEGAPAAKSQKDVTAHIDLKHTSDNHSVRNAAGKVEVPSVQDVLLQTALPMNSFSAKLSQAGVEEALPKGKSTSIEKEHANPKMSSKVARTLESNSKDSSEATAKHNKTAYTQVEIAHRRDLPLPLRQDAANTGAPKGNESGGKVASEHFSLGIMSGLTKTVTLDNFVANSNVTAHTVLNLTGQIAVAVRNASDKIGQKVSVSLNPPELGKISIKFEKDGDQVSGCLQVEKPDTKSHIESNLSQIIQNLHDAGIQLKRFDIILQDQSVRSQQEFAGQAQPDGSQNRNFEADNNSNDPKPGIAGDIHLIHSLQSDSYISDKAVNILV
jgi:flagellar hook-length control protein FliK